MGESATSARYRFSDGSPVGVVLGMSMRQAAPIVVGVAWLTVLLMAGRPIVGALGLGVGLVLSFGRWKRAPLYEVVVPGSSLLIRRWRGREPWTRRSLPATDADAKAADVPGCLRDLELEELQLPWPPGDRAVATIVDRRAGTVSVALAVQGGGFPVASPKEQDVLVATWGSALAPFARAQCPVARVTWQEWTRPAGVGAHRTFLDELGVESPHTAAVEDYETLLDQQAPFTTSHEVVVMLTVELRRVRRRRSTDHLRAAIDVLVDEARQFCSRLSAHGFDVSPPLDSNALVTALRLRSDPCRGSEVDREATLASATGKKAIEWGPIALHADWFDARVDGSFHRSYRVASWPMLPVAADWLAPLLNVTDVTRTVTVVMEPVPTARAAQEANRQMTSIESDQMQKSRHGFRLTARERRRHDDAETRERELAEGHPLFRHVALLTVTSGTLEQLDEDCATIEQAAAQSLLDIRPLAAQQDKAWVASLPLGRSVRQGRWA